MAGRLQLRSTAVEQDVIERDDQAAIGHLRTEIEQLLLQRDENRFSRQRLLLNGRGMLLSAFRLALCSGRLLLRRDCLLATALRGLQLRLTRGPLRSFRLAGAGSDSPLALRLRGCLGDLHSRGLLSQGCTLTSEGGEIVDFGQCAATRNDIVRTA